ncbi:UvrD-helicase domain-containing protein [Bradyrhizobium sp. URHC0002]
MSEVIIAAAGGGKTTRIVQRALERSAERSALVTYTQNNVQEIAGKLYTINRSIPPHTEVWSWYSFLLRELARPYQSALIQWRIKGIHWSQQRSDRFAKQSNTERFYFDSDKLIYSDKIAQFICACDNASQGAVVRRLEQRFDRIYIDEVQDLAGYDLDLVELILRSKIRVTLVGDHRQSTFRTNNSARNRGYVGTKIKKKFQEWNTAGLCEVTNELDTYRCNQSIAAFADNLFPDDPRTISHNLSDTGHDGVFYIHSREVDEYMKKYRPQVLRLDVKTDCSGYDALNFGESKGLSFDRVLIFPHQLGKRWLSTGDSSYVSGSASKLYVGITRARYSVTFVLDEEPKAANITSYTAS